MNGTEKQVKWAIEIRTAQLAIIEKWIPEQIARINDAESPEDAVETIGWLNEWVEIVESQDDAVYWINRRNATWGTWEGKFNSYADMRLDGKTLDDLKNSKFSMTVEVMI